MPLFQPPKLHPLAAEDERSRDYLPIEGYGLIGDCYGAALVGYDGSIDWCCFDRFDAAPVFARLLDRDRGGCFEIRPCDAADVRRRYADDTNILETDFITDTGRVRLTDFMAVNRAPGASSIDTTALTLPGWVIRRVTALSGRMCLRVWYQPVGGGLHAHPLELRMDGERVLADGCPTLHTRLPLRSCGAHALGFLELEPGETRCFILAPAGEPVDGIEKTAQRLRNDTAGFWSDWTAFIGYNGPYRPQVVRSALVLKLVTYAPTGAIIAAPTTSLPEGIGTPRTWDYRFCWLRDAALTLFSLAKLNHANEGRRFFEFLMRVCEETLPRVLPLYGIDGELDLEERLYEELDGYRGSRPVRSGNKAVEQHQLDVYGQIIDLAYLYHCLSGSMTDDIRRIIEDMAGLIVDHWREPDSGLWEPRVPERRHVHSAILSWVGMDRVIRMFGPHPEWCSTRDAILEDIRTNGVDPDGGYLTQTFGNRAADASVLVAPMVDLPIGDKVIRNTVEKVRADLGAGPLIWRYRNEDGLPGEEGAFLLCSFWLVNALLALDRGAEARELFEQLLERANDLHLFSEQMAEDGTFLGNFPQAFTHIGVIHSAIALQLYDCYGVDGVRGTHADRANRVVERDERYRKMWQPAADPQS